MNVIFAYIASIMMLTINPGDYSAKPITEKPLITFGVVSDVQYSDYDPGISRFYRSSLDKLSEAIGQFKTDSVEFIVNLGDLIDKDFESFAPVLEIFEESGIRIYHIAGNHDYSVKKSEKKSIPVLPGEGTRYYSNVIGSIRMIFLDGNDVSIYGPARAADGQRAETMLTDMRSKGVRNALDWNGAIGKTQMKWLTNELNTVQTNNEKAIIFCHFPVAPDDPHNLLNDAEVLGLIVNYPVVKAWFCGHNHHGNYARTGSIHHVNFMGMVETEHENSFAVVRIFGDRIEIKGFGREPDRILDI